MLLVIFGAGASYDSVPHHPPPGPNFTALSIPSVSIPAPVEADRPPLADRLFDSRPIFVDVMRQFRQCMELVPLLRKRDISVEKELAKFQEQAKSFPRAHEELAAIRYYLHVALWNCQNAWREHHLGITNYATLLREIERWRYASDESVCLVTFNYDTMLEEAMRQVLGFAIIDLNSYISHTDYALVKLHGSIDWCREVDGALVGRSYTPQDLIQEAANLRISNRYRLVSNRPVAIERGQVVFPALSIPVERKDEFNCPSEHVDRLNELLPQVTKVMTVGWRATEMDFLQLLRGKIPSSTPLMVVSGNNIGANQTHVTLRRAGFGETAVRIEDGFSGLILKNLETLEDFLRGVSI